nr:ribosome maturation factor RimP [Bacilli bacterium]
MAKEKVTDIVASLVEPIATAHHLSLVDVELKKEGANWFLRIYIDKSEGYVDLDDCSIVSEELSVKLDELDPIPYAYFLEVSSAGAERPLKRPEDFQKSIGKRVFVSFYEPFQGHKSLEGTLVAYSEVMLEVEDKDQRFMVPADKIAGARLAISWS